MSSGSIVGVVVYDLLYVLSATCSFNYPAIKVLLNVTHTLTVRCLSLFCSLFKWHESHFILQNRLEMFAVDDLFLYQADTSTVSGDSADTSTTSGSTGSSSDTLLMVVAYGRQSNRKTRVNVYHIVNEKVEMMQHMFFQVNAIHPFSLENEHYLLECSKRRKFL